MKKEMGQPRRAALRVRESRSAIESRVNANGGGESQCHTQITVTRCEVSETQRLQRSDSERDERHDGQRKHQNVQNRFRRHARSLLTLPNSLAAVRCSACVCGWELRGHAGVPPPPAIPPAPKRAAATRCAPSSALHPLSAWPSSAEITSSSRRRCTTKGWPPPYPS